LLLQWWWILGNGRIGEVKHVEIGLPGDPAGGDPAGGAMNPGFHRVQAR